MTVETPSDYLSHSDDYFHYELIIIDLIIKAIKHIYNDNN